MNKQEFFSELRKRLAGIPQSDREERVAFYGEMIDDRMEEGLTEEEAVSALGTLEELVAQIGSEIPLTKLVKEKVKPNRALRAWEIVLLVLGSPIWLSLLCVLATVIIVGYVVIWSVIISLWVVEISVGACFAAGVFAAVIFTAKGNAASGVAILGVGLLCAGLAIFGFFGCKAFSKSIFAWTKKLVLWIKACFMKGGKTK